MLGMMRRIPGEPELAGAIYDIADGVAIYRARHVGIGCLDFARKFLHTDKYMWRVYSVPDVNRQAFAARAQVEDQISVTPGSYLISISGVCDDVAGFDWLVSDKGTKQTLSSQECHHIAENGGLGAKYPTRPLPFFMNGPWTVSKAGMLTVKMTNLSASATNINLALQFAEKVG